MLTRTVAVTAALGLVATTAAYVVVRTDVDRLNRRRVDRPATDALLGVQSLSASVDQVLATANGVVATSDLDARRFVQVLGPDVRRSATLAGMALVADTSAGPRVAARASATRTCCVTHGPRSSAPLCRRLSVRDGKGGPTSSASPRWSRTTSAPSTSK